MRRKTVTSKAGSGTRAKTTWAASMGALVTAGVVVVALAHTDASALASTGASATIEASQEAQSSPRGQKKYKPTKPIAVDKQTGKPRMPTEAEVEELVSNLATLTARPTELPEAPAQAGGIAVDLEGGFNGVMLARPNEDGSLETRCVFTFEEGIEFLGLVEDIQ